MIRLLSPVLLFFLTIFTAYAQRETDRMFLFESEGEYYLRVEIPYYIDLADSANRIKVDISGVIHHEVSLSTLREHQSKNEYSDYVAIYDFPIGKHSRLKFRELTCKVTFDYRQEEEFYSMEFKKFMWF